LRKYSARAWRPLGGDTGASALFHVIGRFSHGFPSNRASLATGEGAFRLIDGGKDFSAGTFPLRPERKGFSDRVFLAAEPPAIDGLAGKTLSGRG
jgi:hypothetical protein